MVSDTIRIVPLHDPAGLMAAVPPAVLPKPNLTYRGGPLLANVEVFTVFWGSWWQQAARVSLAKQIDQFFQFILSSPLIAQLAEYDTGPYKIGPGKLTGTATLPSPAPGVAEKDANVRALIQSGLKAGHLPAPNPNTLYFVYLPAGTRLAQGGGASCQAFCGYHDMMPGNVYYAAMPYPGCAGCLGGMQPFDALTTTSSHELCEAITDADPGTGWYDDNHGEIGDICAWHTKKVGPYTVQQEWSNKKGACA